VSDFYAMQCETAASINFDTIIIKILANIKKCTNLNEGVCTKPSSVINVVCFLLGNFSASEFYMPTFRNTLPVPSS
jgi:hypothetical protein